MGQILQMLMLATVVEGALSAGASEGYIHSPVGVTGLSMAVGTLIYVPVMSGNLARTDWSRFEHLPLFKAANRMNAYNTYLLMEQEVQ